MVDFIAMMLLNKRVIFCFAPLKEDHLPVSQIRRTVNVTVFTAVSQSFPLLVSMVVRGAGTSLKLGGGGRKRLPGSKVTPTQNSNLIGFGLLFFLGGTQVNVIDKNNRLDSPHQSWGERTHSFQVWGARCPHCPLPPPPVPASLIVVMTGETAAGTALFTAVAPVA